MRIWEQRTIRLSAFVTFSVLVAACASGPQKKTETVDAEAEKRSQIYMANLEVEPLGETGSGTCAVPSWALKPAPARGSGPSKEWPRLVAHANACVKAKIWRNVEILGYALGRADIDSPWGAYFLSLAAEASGDRARALWMIDLAQKKAGGRSGLFMYQKGRILFELGETAQAMELVGRAVQLEKRLTEGHLFLARIYHRDLELERAAKHYQAVLGADGKNFVALAGLAEVKLAQGAGDEAAALYAKLVAAQPSGLQNWLRLAYIQETVQKNPAEALNTYRNLKSSIEKGQIKDRPEFDLAARIKALEESTAPRVPAAKAASVEGGKEDGKKVK